MGIGGMFDFIRPEILAAARRWREVIAGGVVLVLGIWWMFNAQGVLSYLAPLVVLAGFGLGYVGVQRARFRSSGDAAGIVQVDEGQITYFGPETGGAVAIADLERLTLDRSGRIRVWHLDQPGQPHLSIPVDAQGADALFDAFGKLPGLQTERMLKEMHMPQLGAVVIWEKRPSRPAGLRLN